MRDVEGEAEAAELALRARVLARLIAGAVHDIRTPLNTIGLRLPLLSESLDGGAGAAESAASQVRSLREQLDRIKDLVSRLAEVCDPAAPLGYLDLAAYAAQVTGAFGYDAKLGHVDLVLEASRGSVRTSADPARAARVILCLLARAIAATPKDGRLLVRAAARGSAAVLEFDRTPGDAAADFDYDLEVLAGAAEGCGGRLERAPGGQGLERITLTLPGNDRA